MQYRISAEIEWQESELRSDAQGGAFLENRRGAGNLARSRLSGGSWAMSEPSSSAEGRLKAGCSQDWLPHKAALIFIIRCDAAGVMSNLCHLRLPDGAARSAGSHGGVGLQCLRYCALARCRLPCRRAARFHGLTPARQFRFAHVQADAALGNVDLDAVSFFHQRERSALGGFRRHVTDGET